MPILTKSNLLSFRNYRRESPKSISLSLEEFSQESKGEKVTIFLSHKHNELEELDSAISLLKSFGVNIYVDWQDEAMPEITSGITAQKIKEKIKINQKFILLATEGAINSKWCNWELGHGDAEKYLDNIAIFPIRDNYRNYSGSEYLQIYPRIEYVEENTVERAIGGFFQRGYYVIMPKNKDGTSSYYKLSYWLRR
ncbi:hypothetical protein Q4553_13450 [Tenacibaculum soleae]|uniref:hypothetical protein n=1 Tax=Tenacibaculum soleae TaxID=447689 RepID=UPI0026E32DEA|nr:hypothetical protein [Tenacibaculum soleae]MDO6745569.1 hypothetical protein [Tenacibaculum soleae]